MTANTGNLANLDRADKKPLYRQIEADLLTQITEGEFEPGEILPAERVLCDHYGVSRITVRRAMMELESRGYVNRQRGKGTFVSQARIRREIGRLVSFSEEMRGQGRAPDSQLLNLQHSPSDSSMAPLLDLDVGDPIWIVERLRLADDEVISLSTSYLSLPPDIYLTPVELRREPSLWSVLEKKGVEIAQGETTVRATIAGEQYAELLGVEKGAPLLIRDGINYAGPEGSVPIEVFEVVSRADRYQYSLDLVR